MHRFTVALNPEDICQIGKMVYEFISWLVFFRMISCGNWC